MVFSSILSTPLLSWLLKHGGKRGREAGPGRAGFRELCPGFHVQRHPPGLQHPHTAPGSRPSGPQKLLFQAQVQGDHLEGQGPVVQTGQAWVPQRVQAREVLYEHQGKGNSSVNASHPVGHVGWLVGRLGNCCHFAIVRFLVGVDVFYCLAQLKVAFVCI